MIKGLLLLLQVYYVISMAIPGGYKTERLVVGELLSGGVIETTNLLRDLLLSIDGQNYKRLALVDPSLDGIKVPLEDYEEMHRIVFGANSNEVPCISNKLVEFTIDGEIFEVPVSSLIGDSLGGFCASKIGTSSTDKLILGSLSEGKFTKRKRSSHSSSHSSGHSSGGSKGGSSSSGSKGGSSSSGSKGGSGSSSSGSKGGSGSSSSGGKGGSGSSSGSGSGTKGNPPAYTPGDAPPAYSPKGSGSGGTSGGTGSSGSSGSGSSGSGSFGYGSSGYGSGYGNSGYRTGYGTGTGVYVGSTTGHSKNSTQKSLATINKAGILLPIQMFVCILLFNN